MTIAIKEDIKTMLDQVATGNTADAEETFREIIMDKVTSRLEDMKVDIAQEHFNLSNESEDLDEISNELKLNYLKKAPLSAVVHSKISATHPNKDYAQSSFRKSQNRVSGMNRAVSTLTKEDINTEDLDESAELMTRKHLEHIADHIAKTKDDEELHSALKDTFHKIGRHLNSNFRHDYFEGAANGEGRTNRGRGSVNFTKRHKEMIHQAIDSHHYGNDELAHRAHDWATETLDK